MNILRKLAYLEALPLLLALGQGVARVLLLLPRLQELGASVDDADLVLGSRVVG